MRPWEQDAGRPGADAPGTGAEKENRSNRKRMTVNQEQIAQWKKEHGTVFRYTAMKEGSEPKVGYFKKISPQTMDAYETMQKRSKLMADDVVIENCWLGGDEEIVKDDDYRMGLRDWLGLLLVKVAGEMAEL